MSIRESCASFLPEVQSNALKKIRIYSNDNYDETPPSFQSYVDTLFSNHSKSLLELNAPRVEWFSHANCQFTALRKVILYEVTVTTKQFVDIFNFCPNLLEIEIYGIRDSENEVEEEECIVPTLMKFNCDFFCGQDVNIILKMFPGLRELELRNVEFGNVMRVFTITYLPCLYKLNIRGYRWAEIRKDTFDIGRAARHFPELEELKVSDCKIEVSDTDQQFHFPCLQKLELENVDIDDDINILAANLPVCIDLHNCLKK